ncbi:MAG: hypothetical protein ACRC33_23520 [Gemmataceae bacterium]
MTLQLLVIDDRPACAVEIEATLRNKGIAVAVRSVGRESPCRDALGIIRAEGVARVYCLVHLHPAHHNGESGSHGGAVFARSLLDEERPDEADLRQRIVLYSGEADGEQVAADLGLRFVRKDDLGEFLLAE